MISALTNPRFHSFARLTDISSYGDSSQRFNSVKLSSFHASTQLDYRRLPKRPAVKL